MSRYKRKPTTTHQVSVIGMLHIVEVRMVNRHTGETIKQKLLVVGSEAADIEKKLRWVFDISSYAEFSITGVEKVREKVHTISTSITQHREEAKGPLVKQHGEVKEISQENHGGDKYSPNCYAVGITTTMLAKDEEHALRKVGHAIVSSATGVDSHAGAKLSSGATVVIEKLAKSTGFAMPRDVSSETNNARMVRG